MILVFPILISHFDFFYVNFFLCFLFFFRIFFCPSFLFYHFPIWNKYKDEEEGGKGVS